MNVDLQKKTPLYQTILALQSELLRDSEAIHNQPSVEHHFGPNVYLREIFMEAGKHRFVIGASHKTEHFNIVMSGRASVLMDYETGEWQDIQAPSVFISKPGVKKILVIHEDMRWITVHPLSDEHAGKTHEELEELLTEEPPHKVHAEALVQNELRALSRKRDNNRRLA